jgi:hypothetical protein
MRVRSFGEGEKLEELLIIIIILIIIITPWF